MQGIDMSKAGMAAEKAKLQVIFVLGGPGSGKGTQVSPYPASNSSVIVVDMLC